MRAARQTGPRVLPHGLMALWNRWLREELALHFLLSEVLLSYLGSHPSHWVPANLVGHCFRADEGEGLEIKKIFHVPALSSTRACDPPFECDILIKIAFSFQFCFKLIIQSGVLQDILISELSYTVMRKNPVQRFVQILNVKYRGKNKGKKWEGKGMQKEYKEQIINEN